jgi:DNA-binding NtrC family response regulator
VGPLEFNHFQLQQGIGEQSQTIAQSSEKVLSTTDLDSVVSSHIKKILKQTKGRIHGSGGAAELLGINASTLRNRMNKLGIRYRKNEMFS